MSDTALHLGAKPQDAKCICIFVHGRGQSPEMMVDHVINRLSAPDIAYVLPRAQSGSWYAARAVDVLTKPTHQQLAASLDQVHAAVKATQPNIPMMIAGFSQGACLVIEYAMKFGPWNGALASLTGCRVGAATDQRPFANLDGMPAYLTGADADPWIPVDAFAQAAGDLSKAHARLRIDSFPDRPHEVSNTEMLMFNAMLVALSHQQPLWQAAP